MKNKTFKKLGFFFFPMLVLFACKNPEPIPPKGDYEGGYIVINEGQFQHDNASISFISEDFSSVEDSVFYKVNNELLGDVAQSQFFNNDKAYFVMNNSHRVVITNRWTMKKIGLITSRIHSPRYMEKISNRFAVISNWGEIYDANWQDVNDDFLAWVNLDNDVVTDTLHIATGPDKMLFIGGKLYVLIPGVMTLNNKIAIVDPFNRHIMRYMEVGDVPAAIVSDGNEKIWIACKGKEAWTGNETGGKLIQIDPVTDDIIFRMDLNTTQHPYFLNHKNNYLYLLVQHKLYKFSVNSPAVDASTEILDLSNSVITPYGMAIIEDKLFITDAGNFMEPGKVYVFDLETMQQIAIVRAGYLPREIAPNF